MMLISELLALQLASVVKAIIPLYARLRMGSFLSKIPAGRLVSKVLSILKDLAMFEYASLCSYDRRSQVDFAAFQYLTCRRGRR